MKDIVTAVDLINEQAQLEREAQETLPGKFETCTFNQGYIRQPLYACITCTPPPSAHTQRDTTEPAGMCYSCSIACHADHTLFELFPKRNFRCDCGVKGKFGQHRCELDVVEKRNATNKNNKYNHNFEGRYCRCNEIYDPSVEEETMYQCVLCEDWFHERCIGKIPDKVSEFESYICRACVKDHPFIVNQDRRINIGICEPDKAIHKWIMGSTITTATVNATTTTMNSADQNEIAIISHAQTNTCSITNDDHTDNIKIGDTGDKRKRDNLTDEPETSEMESKTKKSKAVDDSMCKNLHGLAQPGELIELFLDEDWRDALCRCDKCAPRYKLNGIDFILQEEKTFEPEEDEDAGKSLMEIGMEQLRKMDRVEALDGLRSFHTMLNQIKPFLQTFKESGKVVTANDVKSFFAQKQQEREERKKNRLSS